MKRNITLTILSLVSILLLSCGTVLLAGRRLGYVITLVGALFAGAMPVLHLTGRGLSPDARSFFFLWTLIALGVIGVFSAILSVRELWRIQRGE